MAAPIIFSTSSVFPNTELGFQLAADYGYDGVELMVNHERRSQSSTSVQKMIDRFGVPVTAIHVPCLVITQPVWGFSPELKLRKSIELALEVGAKTVVVHPPFRWQKEYAADFVALVSSLGEQFPDVSIAVENMYAIEKMGRRVEPYLCHQDPALGDFDSVCLDTSHAAAARQDLLGLYEQMKHRVRHVHLSDSTGSRGDEHLPPGHGTLPLRELAKALNEDGFSGDIVLEVATSKLPESSRRKVTEECLNWTREAFGS
jgi:sugar phosphate isomerase/epimerase